MQQESFLLEPHTPSQKLIKEITGSVQQAGCPCILHFLHIPFKGEKFASMHLSSGAVGRHGDYNLVGKLLLATILHCAMWIAAIFAKPGLHHMLLPIM